MKRRIGIVTAGRNDFWIYQPVLEALAEHSALDPVVLATGTHMDSRFGETVRDIEAAGFSTAYTLPMVPASDSAQAVAEAMGRGMMLFAQAYAAADLDAVMVLGDRFEMFAAAGAAVPFTLPLIHLHGGEVTEGAIDEQFRHAISKLSHLHFTSTEVYRNRLLRMGEEPWRVVVSGAPALDRLSGFKPWSLERLAESLGQCFEQEPLLVTFHPATLNGSEQVEALLAALETFAGPIVLTYPNSDPGHEHIIEQMNRFEARHAGAKLHKSLGAERYFSLMSHAAAMVGNSSSGIIEAASFGLPVVNIGDRQKGRVRGGNVLDVACEREAITAALKRAVSGEFKQQVSGIENPYGGGGAARVIAQTLATTHFDGRLVRKGFVDRA